MYIALWAAAPVAALLLSYALINFLDRARRRRDPEACIVNSHGQFIAQIPHEDLPAWLSRHNSFEIISIANAGHFVVVVYK